MVLVTEQDAGLYFVQITSMDHSGISVEAKMILDSDLRLERSRHQRLVTEEDYNELGVRLYIDARPVEVVKDAYYLKLVMDGQRIVSRTIP
jgi:hypothetical protein